MLELARECDWETIRLLSVQIHDLHASWRPDIYFHSEEPYPKEKFLEDVANRLVYAAKLNGEVVAYEGIGKAMLADVRALARAFGCREVLLGVHPENDRALAFYQKCGFHIRTINLEINA